MRIFKSINADLVRSLFDYDANTGFLTWKINRINASRNYKMFAGK